MKIIYVVVVYNCEHFEKFAIDFFDSVAAQTHKEFILLVVNDNVEEEALNQIVAQYSLQIKSSIILDTQGKYSPSKLRELLISEAIKSGGELLIFADFDESVSSERIREYSQQIGEYAFAFNDFYLVDSNNHPLSCQSCYSQKNIPRIVDNVEQLFSRNFCGLGSSAINLTKLDFSHFYIPDEIIAVDWFLFTWVLLNQGMGVLIENTYAYYRQHQNSFVGFDFKLDESKLYLGLKVKKVHYHFFSQYVSPFQQKFQQLENDILKVERLIADPKNREKYISSVNQKFVTNKFVWWENIKPLKDVGV